MAKQPIFLVGSERSGTTLLRLMLDGHPEVAFAFESEYIVDQVTAERRWPSIDQCVAYLATHRIFGYTGFRIEAGLDYVQLVNSFLEQKQQRDRKPIVGATVHHDFEKLPWLWPDALYIHLLRDGRDVARSVIQMGWAGNTWVASETWETAERAWERLKAQIGPAQYIDVRYEELVARPVEVLTAICRFVGVEYSPALLEYPRHSTYGPPDESLAYQWRRKATMADVQLAEARIGELLRERGYALSGYPVRTLAKHERSALIRQSKWYSRWFRVKRFGLWMYLCDAVSRRVGPRKWRDRVRMALNEIETAHLK